jgi:hypothetical protein
MNKFNEIIILMLLLIRDFNEIIRNTNKIIKNFN